MTPEYIARISHGKDSLKMLDVIITRGLPLDRITTTDVWATDTIRGELPEMLEFKEYADEYIWRKYRIEVEHLCAMRNGKKVTYESMFYHISNRKEYSGAGRAGQGKSRVADAEKILVPETQARISESPRAQSSDSRLSGAPGVSRTSNGVQGWPYQQGPWCQRLKYRF